MKNYIEKRVIAIGEYILETGSTIRNVARIFGVSKSTAHYDATNRLREIKPILADKVKEIMLINWGEKHIRGGNATKIKYKNVPKNRTRKNIC